MQNRIVIQGDLQRRGSLRSRAIDEGRALEYEVLHVLEGNGVLRWRGLADFCKVYRNGACAID